jgi:fructose-1,6-bisphosphatase/sedoheptulose 1,7-bisphosphatase-like protein
MSSSSPNSSLVIPERSSEAAGEKKGTLGPYATLVAGDDIVYSSDDFVKGEEYLFIATGVLDGPLLPGVLVTGEHGVTYTMLIDGISHTLRYITSYHKTIL